MAGKSVKRVRIDAPSSKETNAIITPHVMPMTSCDGDSRAVNGLVEDVVSRLRTELEAATKCIEQLRREKDYEIRQVREEESSRSSTAMKELENRLKADCRREVERVRETVKSRLEADTTRLVGRYERTVKRLSSDLDRCRNELREEIEKRGMSSTTRGGFEAERSRLLNEVRDLKAVKRRLEETIESNAEVDKQRAVELKRTQEACKAEVAKVSKEATAEIRKLLEELKAKDHQLALLDRNQYADRGASLPKHPTVENLSKDCDNNSNDVSMTEKISNLEKDLTQLKEQLVTKEAEKTSLKSRIEELTRELNQKNETTANLRKTANNEQLSTQNSILVKNQPKAVRFLLPGSTSPVLARDVDFVPESDEEENDNESICSDMSCSSSSSSSPEATAFYSENIENNYHLLLTEHLNLQHSLAQLLSSSCKNTSPSSEVINTDENHIIACNLQECISEKDFMKGALEALREQNDQYEENVYHLQQQVSELREQNENLEFRVFELEDCAEKCKLTHTAGAADDLLEKTRGLEDEMSTLKERVAFYRTMENEITMLAGFDLRQSVALVKRQLEGVKNNQSTAEMTAITLPEHVEKLTVPAMTGDAEDISLCAMTCSMSTTSGFDDDDNSCASSVADLRFEEMPSEETWGFDEEECCAGETGSSDRPSCVAETNKNIQKIRALSCQQCLEIDANGTRTTNDEIWMARVEKVEARLALAIQSEERARDQMALLTEEKDRRIAALQEQVDVLEANEFRLSETIRSLERLEETFNLQLQASVRSSCSASPTQSTSGSGSSELDDSTTVDAVGQEVSCFNLDEAFAELAIHETLSDNHIQFKTGEVLKTSLNKLRQAKAESDTVEKRIGELSKSACEDDGDCTGVPVSEAEITSDTSNVMVDFEYEYHELEALFKELKSVLTVENVNVKGEPLPEDLEGGILESDCATVNGACWMAGDMSSSMPATPVFEIQSSSTNFMLERSREFELAERHLIQQVKALEHERDTLRDALCDGDAVMHEFGIQLVELQSSEQTLKGEVSRLKAKEDWLISRNDELMELVGRFEESLKNNRATETDLRSRCERQCARETELSRELEDVRDEQRALETRYRRWIAQLDDEKVRLQSVVDQLSDKNADLEGREAGLLCRIRKLEAIEYGLRGEVADLERSLNEAIDDRDRIIAQVTDKNEDHVRSQVTMSIDCWSQTDDVVLDTEESYRHLEERAEFFKEMLEFTEQSYTALEERLRQHEATEETLRSTILECEQTKIELLAALQFDKDQMAKRISELEATVENIKAQKKTEDCSPANEEETKFSNMKRDVTPAIQAIKVMTPDMDDAELVYWAAVEDVKISQGVVKETDLTSALWSSIEKYMGLTSKTKNPLSLTISIHQPPPLPMSPPPASPDRNDDNVVDSNWGRRQDDDITDSQKVTAANQRRSHSVDLFSSRLLAASSEELRWKRASSESRDVEALPKELKDDDAAYGKTRRRVPRSSSMRTADGESVLERISRSREFWSARSLSAPQPPSPSPLGTSNGRPSLIPRIALPLRAPPTQRSLSSEYGCPKAGPVAMPVIRSTPSPHLSPKLNETELDKKNGRSFIPRPVNEFRIAPDSDGEGSDSVKVSVPGRPGQRKPTKVYTTVLAPNRYVTSKFSHVSGSSLSPRTVRANVPDFKKSLGSPSSSFSTGTYQTWRPVVSSTACGPEEPQLPGSRA